MKIMRTFDGKKLDEKLAEVFSSISVLDFLASEEKLSSSDSSRFLFFGLLFHACSTCVAFSETLLSEQSFNLLINCRYAHKVNNVYESGASQSYTPVTTLHLDLIVLVRVDVEVLAQPVQDKRIVSNVKVILANGNVTMNAACIYDIDVTLRDKRCTS